MHRLKYRFTNESVQLNVEIPDSYSAVQLRRGAYIKDEDGTDFRAIREVSIPVRNGDIRLDRIPGLKLTRESLPRKVVRAGSNWLTWLVLVNFGVILVATVFYLRARGRRAAG